MEKSNAGSLPGHSLPSTKKSFPCCWQQQMGTGSTGAKSSWLCHLSRGTWARNLCEACRVGPGTQQAGTQEVVAVIAGVSAEHGCPHSIWGRGGGTVQRGGKCSQTEPHPCPCPCPRGQRPRPSGKQAPCKFRDLGKLMSSITLWVSISSTENFGANVTSPGGSLLASPPEAVAGAVAGPTAPCCIHGLSTLAGHQPQLSGAACRHGLRTSRALATWDPEMLKTQFGPLEAHTWWASRGVLNPSLKPAQGA